MKKRSLQMAKLLGKLTNLQKTQNSNLIILAIYERILYVTIWLYICSS